MTNHRDTETRRHGGGVAFMKAIYFSVPLCLCASVIPVLGCGQVLALRISRRRHPPATSRL